MDKKRANILIICIILAIIGAIFFIEYLKGWENGEEESLKCISKNAVLYVSKTCSHCANQKLILGNGLKYFDLVDCTSNAQKCIDDKINAVPTWRIGNEKYTGVRTVEQLKELTGC